MSAVELRVRVTLAIAIVLVLPASRSWLDGAMSTADLAWRYLAALLLAWLGTGVLARVIDGYRDSPADSEPPVGL